MYNLEGKEIGELELSDAVFGVKIKPSVVHEVAVAMANNQREPWADTKGKGEVAGGGKKPWQQKGTGRARHGSIRSPIWKGGGVVFGPKTERNYKTKINKKTRRLALKMLLSDRAGAGVLLAVESFNFAEPKTKLFAKFLKVLPLPTKKVLVLADGKDENLLRATNNLQKVKTMRAEDVSALDILNVGLVLAGKDGLKKLENILK